MRIVEFDSPERVTVYPAEGISTFKNTRKIGTKIIGEYYGADNTLINYIGEWPIKSVIYRKKLSRREFKSMFTPQEYRALSLISETDDNVFQLWDIAQTTEPIDLEFEQTSTGLAYIGSIATEANGLPDSNRIAEILKGLI